MRNVESRSLQPEFFAGEGNNSHTALRGIGSQGLRNFDYPGHAGSIVVGAIMYLWLFTAVSRVIAAPPEVIVVRAKHNIFIRERRIRTLDRFPYSVDRRLHHRYLRCCGLRGCDPLVRTPQSG